MIIQWPGNREDGMSFQPSAFAQWLRRAMDRHDLTQQQLANMLESVNRSTVAHWLRYNEVPQTENLLRLAQVFGVEPGDLFNLAGVSPPPDLRLARRGLPPALWISIVTDLDTTPETPEVVSWIPDQIVEAPDQLFAVRVTTDVLTPTIVPGDIIIADRDRSPAIRSVVVVRGDDGTPEVWRLERERSLWMLCRGSGEHVKPLSLRTLRGVMVGLYRPQQAFAWEQGR